MKHRIAMVMAFAAAGVATTTPLLAHEMFLKAQEYVTAPNSDQLARLVNGTFDKSDNSISRDRMADVSIAVNGRVTTPPGKAWYDEDSSSYLRYHTGESGTYVLGVSTRPSIITLSREDFIEYLRHDGILDTLAAFEKGSELAEVRERYSKHVRAIVQVGEERTADHSMPLGYPVEILLDQNPYDLQVGDELSFRVLFMGEPADDQIVRVSYDGYAEGTPDGQGNPYNLRTDQAGRAHFTVSEAAVWYIALIHMQRVDDGEVDYESNWATATFEVR